MQFSNSSTVSLKSNSHQFRQNRNLTPYCDRRRCPRDCTTNCVRRAGSCLVSIRTNHFDYFYSKCFYLTCAILQLRQSELRRQAELVVELFSAVPTIQYDKLGGQVNAKTYNSLPCTRIGSRKLPADHDFGGLCRRDVGHLKGRPASVRRRFRGIRIVSATTSKARTRTI